MYDLLISTLWFFNSLFSIVFFLLHTFIHFFASLRSARRLSSVLDLVPLSPQNLLVAASFALTMLLLNEVAKIFYRMQLSRDHQAISKNMKWLFRSNIVIALLQKKQVLRFFLVSSLSKPWNSIDSHSMAIDGLLLWAQSIIPEWMHKKLADWNLLAHRWNLSKNVSTCLYYYQFYSYILSLFKASMNVHWGILCQSWSIQKALVIWLQVRGCSSTRPIFSRLPTPSSTSWTMVRRFFWMGSLKSIFMLGQS